MEGFSGWRRWKRCFLFFFKCPTIWRIDFPSSLTAPLAQSTFTLAINIRGHMEMSKSGQTPSLPPRQRWRPSWLLISWEARRRPESGRASAHTPADVNQTHNEWRLSLPAAAIKSPGNGASAQLDGCAFVSGLLASDMGWHLRQGRGYGSSHGSGPAPVAPRQIGRPRIKAATRVSCHARAPAFGFHHNTQSGKHTRWRQNYSTHETDGQSWWSASC